MQQGSVTSERYSYLTVEPRPQENISGGKPSLGIRELGSSQLVSSTD